MSRQKIAIEDNTVGQRFKQIRISKGLTQRDFAGNLGFATSQIAENETGKREPSRNLLMALKTHYKISIDWVLTGEGEMFEQKKQPIIQDRTTELIVDILNSMTKEEKHDILRSVEKEKLLKDLKEELIHRKTG